MRNATIATVSAAAVLLGGCGLQSFSRSDASVARAAAAVEAEERARLDLVGPLVDAAAGRVEPTVEARARAAADLARGSLEVLASGQRTPAALVASERDQAGLRSALLRLMESAERSPRLRADPAYRASQARLEAADGRVASAQRLLLEARQARSALRDVGLTGLHAGELALDGVRRLGQGDEHQVVAGAARLTAGLAGVVGVAWELR